VNTELSSPVLALVLIILCPHRRLRRLPHSSPLSSSPPSYSLSSLSSPSLSQLILVPRCLNSSSRVTTLCLWSRPYPIPHISSQKNLLISPTGHLHNLEPTPNPILPAPQPTICARSRRWHFTELPQVISEVITLQMNEEVAGQLHLGAISLMDKQHAHINALEERIDGLELLNHQLKKNYVTLASNMEQVRMQSVMCHAMLMHYIETHWEPISHLFAQIGLLSSCGVIPPTGTYTCNIVNETFNSQGVDGPDSPSSLPSLKSQSSSSIDSIYHSPSLLSTPVPSPVATSEEFTIVFGGESTTLSMMPSSFSRDLGSFEEIDPREVSEGSSPEVPLFGDAGWVAGGSGHDEMDLIAGGYRVGV